MKKDQNLPNKNIHSNKSSGKPLLTIIPLENNHFTKITIAQDLHIEEIHKISHKIDIVDQTLKTINIEINIQDQTRTEVTTQTTKGIVFTKTPKIEIVQTTVLNVPHLTETETTRTIGVDNIQITDHESIQTINRIIVIIIKNHVTIPRNKILVIQIEKKTFSITA